MLDAARLVVGARDVEGQAVLVDEDIAEHRVHDATRVGEYRLEVLAGGDTLAGGAIEIGDPPARVLDAARDVGRRLERGPAARHQFLGAQRRQRIERGGPFLELGVARVDACVVLDEVAREADPLGRDPGDRVAARVSGPDVHDAYLEPAQEQRELALEYHRRPGEPWDRLDRAEQSREA